MQNLHAVEWGTLRGLYESDNRLISVPTKIGVGAFIIIEQLARGKSTLSEKIGVRLSPSERRFFSNKADNHLVDYADSILKTYEAGNNTFSDKISEEQLRSHLPELTNSYDAMVALVMQLRVEGQYQKALQTISDWVNQLKKGPYKEYKAHVSIPFASGTVMTISFIFGSLADRLRSQIYEAVVEDNAWRIKDPSFFYLQAAIHLMNAEIDNVMSSEHRENRRIKIESLLEKSGYFEE